MVWRHSQCLQTLPQESLLSDISTFPYNYYHKTFPYNYYHKIFPYNYNPQKIPIQLLPTKNSHTIITHKKFPYKISAFPYNYYPQKISTFPYNYYPQKNSLTIITPKNPRPLLPTTNSHTIIIYQKFPIQLLPTKNTTKSSCRLCGLSDAIMFYVVKIFLKRQNTIIRKYLFGLPQLSFIQHHDEGTQ